MYGGEAGHGENQFRKNRPERFLTWCCFLHHGPEGVRAGKARIIPVSVLNNL